MDVSEYLEDFYRHCLDIQAKKRNDYTSSLDPFYNYTSSGEAMGVSAGLSMLGRLQEKLIRLSLYLKGNKLMVNDEGFRDTCTDMSILSGLICAWIDREKVPPVCDILADLKLARELIKEQDQREDNAKE